jgi:hypothetical protein
MSPKLKGNSNLPYILIGGTFVLYLIIKLAIPQVTFWVQANWVLTIIILATLIMLSILGIVLYLRHRKSDDMKFAEYQRANAERKRLIEEEKRSKGFEPFIDSAGNEIWGTYEQVQAWKVGQLRQSFIGNKNTDSQYIGQNPPRLPISAETKRQVDIRAGSICQWAGCTKDGYLEIHHIDRNRSHNRLSNLILLCGHHHNNADHGAKPSWVLHYWAKRNNSTL